jgi:hypothetical protein
MFFKLHKEWQAHSYIVTIHIQTGTIYSVFIQHEAYNVTSHSISTLDLLLLAFMEIYK